MAFLVGLQPIVHRGPTRPLPLHFPGPTPTDLTYTRIALRTSKLREGG